MRITTQIVDSAFTGVRKVGDPTSIKSTDEFHLGSCTKAMTATLIGMLVDEGKLRWNSTLSELFPEIKMDDGYKTVTIEMIGAHRAGFPANVTDSALWNSLWSKDSLTGRKLVLASVLASAPTTAPGTQYVYSNVGYMVLGSVVDRMSGTDWESFIQKRLFDPLGMSSCGFGPAGDPNASPPDEPWGHKQNGSELIPVPPDLNGDNPPAMNSAARVHCSLKDWGKFLQMHADGFNGKPGLLVTPASFLKLHTAYPGQDYTYGGWILTQRAWAGGPVLTHEGSNTFNVADVWIAPLKNEIFMAAVNLKNDVAENAYSEALDYLIEPSKNSSQSNK